MNTNFVEDARVVNVGRSTNRQGRGPTGKPIAAIYARYSTKFQDSVEDQVRECKAWADKNGFMVPEEFVFVDRGVRGASRRRAGLDGLRAAIEARRVDAVIIFATSRLFRKMHEALRFVSEEIVERRIRGVFVKSGIDTADKNDWELHLQIQAMMDQRQTKASVAHIQAAYVGLLIDQKVFGTLTFGYTGEPLEGSTTRTGKPSRRLTVDSDASGWVRRIFAWYVEGLSRPEIARRLNSMGSPLPPRCATGRWTVLAVKTVLANERYRGIWQYGRKESKWQSRGDYVRQFERQEPLKVTEFKELRIVDDVTWFKAQARRANDPHNAGRKPVDGNRRSRPLLLNGLLRCGYHDRPLIVAGGNGRLALCPACREDGARQLYSLLNRRVALLMICRQIAELLRSDKDMVQRVIAACRTAVEAHQCPGEGHLDNIQSQRNRLTQQIKDVMDLYAFTDEDRRENNGKATQLRQQRAALDAEIAHLRAAAAQPTQIPTADEVAALLASFESIMTQAADSDDAAITSKARQIIEKVVGGRIMVYQVGPRQRQRGWLKGVFNERILDLVAGHYGIADDGTGSPVEVEFREPPIAEQIVEEAKSLWDSGLKYREIAAKVGWNRNIVADAIAHWHHVRGLDAPDGRSCVSRLSRPPRLAERIADQVMELVGQDVSLTEIARRLDTSRNRITEAMKIWHRERGLTATDGRALRKQRNQRKRQSA